MSTVTLLVADVLDQVVDGPHGGAVAHDRIELVAGLQFPAQVAVLGPHFAGSERLFRGDHQLIRVERLGDVVERAEFDRLHGRGDFGDSRS